ncbi:MAG: indole-3-glycerol phosphate synthase TrpC [Candidatus Omnitrophica bacterium]|nr:indole-3-glycerol phosphate synthase TrpC [Candidatus Omnitrophota bacterium]
MPNDFLDKIIRQKTEAIAHRLSYYQNLKSNFERSTYSRYSLFKKTIAMPGKIHLIAEIKKASPSKGIIREDFDVGALATAYQDSGASAFSVLTEEAFFQGKPAYLKRVSDEFQLPTLMKDFIIDELQLFEARYCGASAVLLIVAILDDGLLKQLIAKAHALDLDCLVEVHDRQELDRAVAAGAEIVGINNRNLRTFEVSLKVCEALIPLVPKDKVIVAESGISTHADVLRLQELGANAVLIGETFMRERDVARKVKEVMDGQS